MTDNISAQKVREMRAAIEQAVAQIRSAVKYTEVERLIIAGDVEGVIDLLGLDKSAFAPLLESARDSYKTGADYTAEVLSPIPTPVGSIQFRFDMTSTDAVQWLSTLSSNLITEVVEDQREMVRTVLAGYTAQGVNPRTQALDLVGRVDKTSGKRVGGFIGLTTQQSQWVQNARAELESLDANYLTRALRDKRFDATIIKAIKNNEQLPRSTIDAAITRMQSRALKYRADTIARTEAINALRAGQAQSIANAIERGKITENEVTKEWDSSGDDGRTRDSHLMMEGQKQRFPDPFITIEGYRLMYPGDSSLGAPGKETIQCRCRAVYRIDFIGVSRRVEGFR